MTSNGRELKPIVGEQDSSTARRDKPAEIRKRKATDKLNNERRWNKASAQEPAVTEVQGAFKAFDNLVKLVGDASNENMLPHDWTTGVQNGLTGLQTLRCEILMPENQSNVDKYVYNGLVGNVVQFLEHSHQLLKQKDPLGEPSLEVLAQAQHEASRCLQNIAMGKRSFEILQLPGCIDTLGQLIKASDVPSVRQCCIGCVANIAGMETAWFEDRLKMLRNKELMTGIYKNLDNPVDADMFRICIWALGNLMKGAETLQQINEPLNKVLGHVKNAWLLNDEWSINETMIALRNAMAGNQGAIEFVGKFGKESNGGSDGLMKKVAQRAWDLYELLDKERFVLIYGIDVYERTLQHWQSQGLTQPQDLLNSFVVAWRCLDSFARIHEFFHGAYLLMPLESKLRKPPNIFSIAKKIMCSGRPDFALVAEVCSTLTTVVDAPYGIIEFTRLLLVRDAIDVAFKCPGQYKPKVITLICQYVLNGHEKEHTSFIVETRSHHDGLKLFVDCLRMLHDVVLTRHILDTFEYLLMVDSERNEELRVKENLYEIKAHELIEQLQFAGDKDVRTKSETIVNMYFNHKEEEENEDLVGIEPMNNGQSFLFPTADVDDTTNVVRTNPSFRLT